MLKDYRMRKNINSKMSLILRELGCERDGSQLRAQLTLQRNPVWVTHPRGSSQLSNSHSTTAPSSGLLWHSIHLVHLLVAKTLRLRK